VGDASHINRPLAAPGCHGLSVGRHDVYRRRDPAAAPRVSWSAEQGCGDIVRLHGARSRVAPSNHCALFGVAFDGDRTPAPSPRIGQTHDFWTRDHLIRDGDTT
jgi:hypothetical protein